MGNSLEARVAKLEGGSGQECILVAYENLHPDGLLEVTGFADAGSRIMSEAELAALAVPGQSIVIRYVVPVSP